MLAILAALRQEIRDYVGPRGFSETAREGGTRFYQSPAARDVVVVEGGVGRTRAEKATRQTVERFRPDLIVSAGFAGAVKPGLRTSDLILCDRVWAAEGPARTWSSEAAPSRPMEAGAALADRLDAALQLVAGKTARGACLSVPQVIAGKAEKARIGNDFPVSIVDMESFWVSQTAAGYGVPHVVVRSVLDPVEQSLPPFVSLVAASGDRGGWWPVLRHVLATPAEIPGLVRLAAQARAASRTLGAFLAAFASEPRTREAVRPVEVEGPSWRS